MKYPNLYKAFNQFVTIPIEEYLDLEDRLILKPLTKKEFLVKEGQRLYYLPFINNGLMINYRIDNEGYRHVIQIGWKGYWLGDLHSFFSGNATVFNIQAYQETELLLISHDVYDFIIKKHPIYEKHFLISVQKAYLNTLNQLYNLHSLSAEQRYLELIGKVPSILDDMPHYLIASYLNIQSQTLSRIRKGLKTD